MKNSIHDVKWQYWDGEKWKEIKGGPDLSMAFIQEYPVEYPRAGRLIEVGEET